MEIEYIRTETMDTKKEILQCPICQTAYSRNHNLLQHSKKFYSESIASKMPPKKAKKIQTLPIIVDDFLHSFTMIIPGATISGKTECVKRWCHPYQRKPYIMLQVLATILRTEC